jgi:hypothetical protein
LSASAKARTCAPAFGFANARSTQFGSGALQPSGKVASTIGTNATGTAADAATACDNGYACASLHSAAKVSGENRNGVRL